MQSLDVGRPLTPIPTYRETRVHVSRPYRLFVATAPSMCWRPEINLFKGMCTKVTISIFLFQSREETILKSNQFLFAYVFHLANTIYIWQYQSKPNQIANTASKNQNTNQPTNQQTYQVNQQVQTNPLVAPTNKGAQKLSELQRVQRSRILDGLWFVVNGSRASVHWIRCLFKGDGVVWSVKLIVSTTSLFTWLANTITYSWKPGANAAIRTSRSIKCDSIAGFTASSKYFPLHYCHHSCTW